MLALITAAASSWLQAADPLVERDKAAVAAVTARCLACHSSAKREGDVDLEQPLAGAAAAAKADPDLWDRVLDNIESGEMPPKEAAPLTEQEKSDVRDWAQRTLDAIAIRTDGDPGPVSLRRLSTMEYTYTVRDLTGVESLDPVRGLRAQQQGSTNQAAAQGGMSEALLAKYLEAAREVASHAALYPDGITFAPSIHRQDQVDELLTRIRRFYGRFTGDPDTVVSPQGNRIF